MIYKKITKYLIFFFIIFYTTLTNANDKIYYLDMDFLINNSLAGKSINKQIEQKNQNNIKTFKKKEQDLKKEETKLITQKKITDKDEYEKKIIIFRNKVIDLKKLGIKKANSLKKEKLEAKASLFDSITPIIVDYAKENSASIIFDKKNIVLGKSELDITKDILKILNAKIKNIKLN
jgi:outer membrane protein